MGKRNGGFSLIETLVSIVILGAMVVPTCTALVMTVKLNDKTEKMLQAQLAVSSAVETLMASGYDPDMANDFEDVKISDTKNAEGQTMHVEVTNAEGVKTIVAYAITVASSDDLVSVDTVIRAGGDS